MAILTKEQFTEQYNQKLASGVSPKDAVSQIAQSNSFKTPSSPKSTSAGKPQAVKNGTTLPGQSQPSKSAYNPMDDIMHMLEPKAPTQPTKQYVTGNAALDAWRSSVNTLANERKEKEAKAKAEAEQKEYKQLQSQLDRIDANRAYVTTTEQNDALEKERASVVQRMREIDGGTTSTGLDERLKKLFAGTGLERLGSDVGAMRGLYEAGQKNRTAQYQQAYDELQPQIARAQTAYNEMRALYGEAGATAEYNVLKDLQRRSDAYKKVLDENIQQRATAATSEMANSLTETGGAKLEEAKQGLGKVGRFGVDAANAGANYLLDAALGRFGGSALTNAAMGARSFGQIAQAAEASGADIGRQIGAGTAMAAKTIITNKFTDGLAGLYGKGAADDIIETVIGKLGKTDAGRNALRVLAKSAGEGAEELVDAKLDPLVSLIYDNGAALEQKYGSGWQGYKEAAADDLYSALIGFTLGAAAQGVSAAKGDYSRANAEINRKASATGEFKRGPLPYVEWNPDISAEERTRIEQRDLETYGGAENPAAPAQQPQTRTETQGGNFTPTTPANVKQGGSDELNSALNLNSRDATAEAQENTASTQETESTAVNDDPAKHTPEEQARIEEYKAATDENLVNYIETVRDNPGAKIGRYSLKPVSDKAAADIKAITGVDVSGNKTVIEPRIIEHILKRHGKDGAANNSMRDVNDIARIQYVIDNYDNVEDGGRSSAYQTVKPNGKPGQAQTVKFSKAINGTYYVIEAVPDTKAKTVFVTSAYLSNKKAGDMQTANAEATRVTSETKNAQSPVYETSSRPGSPQASGVTGDVSIASIPTTARNVNSENGVESDLGSKSPRARTSQTAETIMEADITSDERAAQLNPYVQNGRFDYIPDTNARQTHRAEQAITEKGWTQAVQEFHDSVVAGKSGKDLVARGAVLLNNAGNSDASSRAYLDLASDVIELGHRAGETLQAFKILQQLTPQGRLYLMEKTVEQINRALTDGQKKSIAKEQLGKAYDRKAIRDTVDDYGVKLDEGLVDEYLKAKTDKQRNEIISQMQQSIADQIPTTFSEGFTALRYLNMLGNFKTQERNILGNTAMLVTTSTKNRVKAVGELTANLFRKNKLERTASIIVKPSLLKEATADFANVADIASGGDKHLSESRRFASEIEDKRTIFKVNGTWGKEADSNFLSAEARKVADKGAAALEGARKLTNWAMEAGDAIFLKANYADALGGWLQAHGIKSISEATQEQLDRGRAYAIKEAQEATFRDSNVISNWVSSVGRGQNTPALARAALEGVAPFRKTPANVAIRAIEYSPVGVAETIYKGVKAAKGEGTATDVINSAAKNVTGSALAVAGYFLAKAGLARGGEDDDKLDAFQTMQGKQDYSIRVGDTWLSLSQFAPTTIPFFMGVKFYELADGGRITLDDALGVLGCISDPMLDMSMLSGVNEALDAVSSFGGDSDALPKLLMNSIVAYLSQGITNTLMGQFEQASEENRQTNYTTGDNWLGKSVGYTWGKLTAKIPGIDYNQQDYVDAWGRTQSNGGHMMRAFNAFINPTYGSKDKTTYVDAELERIYAAGKNIDGFPNVFPQKASRSMEIAKGQTMTPDEYVQYSKERGSKSLELVHDFMESDEYKLLSDEQRATVISDLYSLAADRALKNVRAAHNIKHTTENKYLGVADENIPEYLATARLFTDAQDSGSKSTYNALDDILSRFDKLPDDVQDKLRSNNLNVNQLRYASKLGIDSAEWYDDNKAVAEGKKKLGGSDVATAISIYNNSAGKSDEEILDAMRSQLTPDSSRGGKQNATVRQAEAYIARAKERGASAELGAWLNLCGELKDADTNNSISKSDAYAAWANMGLSNTDTYAGITRNDFYNIVKSNGGLASNPKYATQIDEIYALLVPPKEKTKADFSGSVRGY
nr:MAG TPA: nuclease [Caudoviricetes sp.]